MKSERGFTLIELMIYSMLSIVVLLIVGGFLINSLRAENTVRDSTEATTSGQLVSQSIGKAIRNASAFQSTTPFAGAVMLTARTTRSATEWDCQAWTYSNGEIRTTTSTTAIPAPTASSVQGWTLLSDSIVPVAGTPVLDISGHQVDLNFQVSTGTGKPVLIRTSALSRQPVPVTGVESAPCF